jgi:putative methionine-R-sulfoxide reductase with GAF domain
VVPVKDRTGVVVAVLDIDSVDLNDFDATDADGLEGLCALVATSNG